MSTVPDFEEKPGQDVHVENAGFDLAKSDKLDDIAIEYPSNLAEFPEAPSFELVRQGLVLQEEDGRLSLPKALGINYRQILLALPFLVACMGQGFDSGASAITGTMPSFLIKFGEINPLTESLFIPSDWLSAWSGMLAAGQAIGALAAGPLIDRIGPKRTTWGFSVIMMIAAAIQTASVNRTMLLIGKLVGGVPMGAFLTAASNYISETSTVRLRAPVSSLILLSTALGLCFGLTTGYTRIADLNDWTSWRLVFAMQWVFPVVSAFTLLAVPDSPAYFVKRNQPAKARSQLEKLFGRTDEEYIRARLASIQHNVALEQDLISKVGTASWKDLLGTRSDTLRTLTCCGLFFCTALAGTAFLSNGIYFLSQQGIPITEIFGIALGIIGLLAFTGPLVGIIMETLGRRNCFLYGNLLHASLLAALGGLGTVGRTTGGVGWALSILMNLGTITGNLGTVGPAYALINEVPSLRLRAKTQAVALVVFSVSSCVFSIFTPYMFQAPGNWGAKTGFFYAGTTLLAIIWGFFFLPELRNRSPQDIDALYEHRINPRKFKHTDVGSLVLLHRHVA